MYQKILCDKYDVLQNNTILLSNKIYNGGSGVTNISLWTSYGLKDIISTVLHITLGITSDLWDMVEQKHKYISNVTDEEHFLVIKTKR